jgi:hypothetical protein
MCKKAGCDGNIIWTSNNDDNGEVTYTKGDKVKALCIENNKDDVSMVIYGECDVCNVPHFAVVFGDIELDQTATENRNL